jgi:hypothetical protein
MALFRPEISNFLGPDLGRGDAIPSEIPDFRKKNYSFLSQIGKSQQLHLKNKSPTKQLALERPVFDSQRFGYAFRESNEKKKACFAGLPRVEREKKSAHRVLESMVEKA